MNRSISVPDDLDARVEAARGDVPRSVFWVRAMEKALGGVPEVAAPAPSRPPQAATPQEAIRKGLQAPRATARTPSPLAARQQALNKSKGM